MILFCIQAPVIAAPYSSCLLLGRKATTNLDSILKSRDITLPIKVHIAKALVFPVVLMWELDHKEGWMLKNWCFGALVLEETFESPLDCMEIEPVNLKGNQPWIFIGRTEAEAPPLCPPDLKHWLIRKDPDAGKDWRQEKGMIWQDGWMASLTHWTWVWACSERWWRTRKPGVLQSMGLQRVRHDWVTEQWQSPYLWLMDME